MYESLADLEEINTKCRIHLSKLLATRHRIRTGVVTPDNVETNGRGGIFFAAFDPWDTCLRCPPGSFRYFDMAERIGLIEATDAVRLSKTLLRHGADLAAVYNGRFSSFFDEPRVKTILGQAHDLEHLSASGLAVGASWADRLFEISPIPLLPEKHLEGQSFQSIAHSGEIEFYAQTPWLAWMEALDLICLGPWVGLRTDEIIQILDSLRQLAAHNRHVYTPVQERPLGEKIVIPFFSNGLQGIVVGFFYGVDSAQKELMYTTLIQFGQTLADAYASLRMQRLSEALTKDLDLDDVARELIHVVSPVKRLVVSKDGRTVGYALSKEHNYWSGYQKLSPNELAPDPLSMGFTVDGPDGVAIYIEPLTDVPNFHHQFTHIRIEMCLRRCFGASPNGKSNTVLSNGHVERLHSELNAAALEHGASLAKLRQCYIVARVQAQWAEGRLNLSNFEMKKYLERKLGKQVKNGYQVTSYVSEIEKIFDNRVTVKKTRNALSLQWSTGSSPA